MNKIALSLTAAAVLACASTAANALPTYSTGSFAFTGLATSQTGNVVTATSFPLTSPLFNKPLVASPNGSFTSVVLPTDVTLGGLTLDFTPSAAELATFDFSDPGLGTFTATAGDLVNLGHSTSGGSTEQGYAIGGTFVLGSDWSNAGATLSADETWALDQTGGPHNAIGLSGTFHAPTTLMPEPMSLALFGSGLAGLAIARRRKKQ